VTKDGRVLVFRSGQEVAVIAGSAAERLRPRLAASHETAQQALARATGKYRRGDEERQPRR
jgi:hypothetical protein